MVATPWSGIGRGGRKQQRSKHSGAALRTELPEHAVSGGLASIGMSQVAAPKMVMGSALELPNDVSCDRERLSQVGRIDLMETEGAVLFCLRVYMGIQVFGLFL